MVFYEFYTSNCKCDTRSYWRPIHEHRPNQSNHAHDLGNGKHNCTNPARYHQAVNLTGLMSHHRHGAGFLLEGTLSKEVIFVASPCPAEHRHRERREGHSGEFTRLTAIITR